MLRRSAVTPSLVLLAGGLFLGCSSATSGFRASLSPQEPGTVTDDQIEASGARTAWQALKYTTALHVQDDDTGNPGEIYHRGKSSISSDNIPLLVMDGAIVSDFRHLDQIPASDLLRIRIRSPSTASAEYGALARAGVVELFTRRY